MPAAPMPPPTHMVTRPYSVRGFAWCARGGGQLGASATERMTESDGSPVDVHLRGIEAELLDDRQRLRGEGFVQLDEVDLIEGEPGQLERLGNGINGPMPISSGKQPAVAKETKRARGWMPRAAARSADMTTAAAAPSEVCDEFPAVTVPFGVKGGFEGG